MERISMTNLTTKKIDFGLKLVEKCYPDKFNMTCSKNGKFLFQKIDVSKFNLTINLSNDSSVNSSGNYTCSFQHEFGTKMNLSNKTFTLIIDSVKETSEPGNFYFSILLSI